MEKTEGYYLNKKIVQNSELTGNEKLILSILIQYWKNTKYKKKECIDTVSFTFLKNMTGIKNVHTVTKAIENFISNNPIATILIIILIFSIPTIIIILLIILFIKFAKKK